MKKLYMMGVALAAVAFTANAQGFPEPTLIDPTPGASIITIDQLQNFTVDWGTEIQFVNPQSTNEANVEVFGSYMTLKEVAQSIDPDLEVTVDYYSIIDCSCPVPFGDPIVKLYVGLYSNSGDEAGNGTDEIAATGIFCLGFGVDSTGVPTNLDAIAGNISITIPQALVEAVANTSQRNALKQYNFQVMEVTYTGGAFSPAPGTGNSYTPSELKNVQVTWEDYNTVTLSGSSNGPAYANVNDMENGDTDGKVFNGTPIPNQYISTNGNALVLDLSFLGNGEWNIRIPMGYVVLDGKETNMEDQCTYLIGVYNGEATFTPDEGGTVLNISWDNATDITLNSGVNLTIVAANNDSGNTTNITVPASAISVTGTNNSVVAVDFNMITLADGYYRLLVPEGFVSFMSDGQSYDNPADFYNFNYPGLSGVKTIGVSSEAQTIYNLNGVKVNNNNLKPGVYVVNGKKVVVK